ncbi:hypothetical protein [Telmatospirillum sp.]|uniref:hypothetical protein n=1 Tax=Telmatospirillum sp. TaxID=2079197 RepID=UPI00284B0666|nr:hypothetical protein [Telmatospirillum sp.]MDR3438782.1 hypothetical protein [Telmatospirillum sp.]
MLPTDDDDFRDALATSVAVVCLVSELLMHRRPGGDLCLSPQAADGLTDVLHLVRAALVEAKDRLAHTTTNEIPP